MKAAARRAQQNLCLADGETHRQVIARRARFRRLNLSLDAHGAEPVSIPAALARALARVLRGHLEVSYDVARQWAALLDSTGGTK